MFGSHMRSVILGVMVAVVAMSGAAPAQAQVSAAATRGAYTVEPFAPGSQVTIQGAGVRLRAEPFVATDIPVLSSGSTGLPLNVVGIARLPDWNWYQVVLKSGQKAFIRSDYTSAPSKGGASQPPTLPAPTRIDYGTAPASAPAPIIPPTATPVAPQPTDAISLRPAPGSGPVAAPAAAPAGSRPLDPPISLRPGSAPAAMPAQPVASAAPQNSDSAISLRPASPLPTGSIPTSAPAAPAPNAFAPAPSTPPQQTPGDLMPSAARSSNSDGLTSRP
jgi:hypothetical protein